MNKHPLQIVLEKLSLETDQFSVCGYSGRGMGKKKCLAISGVATDILELNLEEKVGRDLSDKLSHERFFGIPSDNTGLNVVYYWPNIYYVE